MAGVAAAAAVGGRCHGALRRELPVAAFSLPSLQHMLQLL
jgi:hypothetical protein